MGDDAVGVDLARKAQDVAEIYCEPTERAFRFVQVFTASFSSLSHGANDVANAIGPFCTVYHVWNTGYPKLNTKAKAKVPVEDWILAFGGIMIDIGLAFDGWRIMSNLGNNLTYQSPARGWVPFFRYVFFLILEILVRGCVPGVFFSQCL